jgi:hypothetical protein
MKSTHWNRLFVLVVLLTFWSAQVEAACIFACNHNNGTDAKNTGADNSADCDGDNIYGSKGGSCVRITTGALEGAGSFSTGATTASSLVQVDLGAGATRATRNKFNLAVDGLTTSGDYMDVAVLKGGGDTVQAYARIENSSGTLQVQGYVKVADDSFQPIGSAIPISSATTYQVELKRAMNTANGAWLKLWNEAGSSQVGSTQQLSGYTTKNSTHSYVVAGALTIQSTANSTLYIDQFQVDNADFVGPVVTGGTPPPAQIIVIQCD